MTINFQFRINHVYCPQKHYLDQIISDDAHKLKITLKAVQELRVLDIQIYKDVVIKTLWQRYKDRKAN